MRALLDTNILIDYLKGIEEARREIARYSDPLISPITWMEVMVGTEPNQEAVVRGFLMGFDQVPLDLEVAERAVQLRSKHRIRLPDAIIWASAQTRSALLVSRNTRDFPADEPEIRVPYWL